MGIPTITVAGSSASGINAVSPGLPAGFQPNDIFLLFMENQDAGAIGTVTGYTAGPVAFASTGTPTRLDCRWRRAVAGDADPSIPDPGDHITAQILGVRGCITTGSPIDAFAQNTELVADTTVSIPGSTTTGANRLVIAGFSTGQDIASTAGANTWADATLGSPTERLDFWAAAGLGGGFAVASGTKATAGAWGPTTATLALAANFKALISFALIGSDVPPILVMAPRT